MNAMTKDIDELRWYPLYTKSKHEKKAYENLVKAGFEAFLPLKKSERKWSDRKKIIDMPLIPSYVFSRFTRSEINDVLKVYGVSRYIKFNGRPAYIRDSEIELLKKALETDNKIKSITNSNLKKGSFVKILSGPFKGYYGKVIRSSGNKKLVIELEAINQTFCVTLDRFTDIKKDKNNQD
jgi:transcriptional antiterminator RfaH